MAQYMLLLHRGPSVFAGLSPEEGRALVEKYHAWGQMLAAEGRFVASHKLRDEGGFHLAERSGEALVTDGPYAEAKEVLGGYFLIEAADYDEAAEVAKGCPHLHYGRIELREVDPLR